MELHGYPALWRPSNSATQRTQPPHALLRICHLVYWCQTLMNCLVREAAECRISMTTRILFSVGTDLITRQQVAIPFELVHAHLSPAWDKQGSGLLISTNGLGSGNDLAEAALHATCEVIERDALALQLARDPALTMCLPPQIDLEAVSDHTCVELIERCRAAGLLLSAYNITSDIPVPVIYCRLSDAICPPFACTDGAGCHPSSALALRRAITEAAQTRLTVISGARDDLSFADYARSSPVAIRKRQDCNLIGLPIESDCPLKTAAETLAWLLSMMHSTGITMVACVALESSADGLCFVRVVIPGLEGSNSFNTISAGSSSAPCSRG